jgi:hypothetical protein
MCQQWAPAFAHRKQYTATNGNAHTRSLCNSDHDAYTCSNQHASSDEYAAADQHSTADEYCPTYEHCPAYAGVDANSNCDVNPMCDTNRNADRDAAANPHLGAERYTRFAPNCYRVRAVRYNGYSGRIGGADDARESKRNAHRITGPHGNWTCYAHGNLDLPTYPHADSDYD